MLILLPVAAYASAAAGLLWLAHRFVLPVRRKIALVLSCLPLLLTGPAMLTGSAYGAVDILYAAPPFRAYREALGVPATPQSPGLGDVVGQHIPWRAGFRRAASEGRVPLWNPNVMAGEPLLAAQQAGIFQPGAWLGLLLPAAPAWTFDLTLRILIALLGAYLFLRDLGCGEAPSLLGAAGWALADFSIGFLAFSIAPPTAVLPFSLLGARRVARAPGRCSVALLVAALSAGLVGGHPETVLHTGAATGLYFLFELAGAGPGRRLQALGLALLSAGLALGLCAVVILPLAEILPGTVEHYLRKNWYALQKRSVPWSESLLRLAPQVVPYAFGVDGHGAVKEGFSLPSAYAGALLYPFALTGLATKRRVAWFFACLGLAGLSVCVKTSSADLLAKLPLLDIAINEYLIVLPAFALCVLGALGAERIRRGQGRGALLAGAGATLILVSLLYRHFAPVMKALGMPAGFRRERLLLQLIPLVLGVCAALLARGRLAPAGLAAAVAVFVASRILETGRINPTIPAQAFYPPIPILSKIPRGVPERMAALGFNFLPNASAVYGLEDVRGYSALTLGSLWQTFPLWCVPQPVWYNRIDDPTTPFLSFLNVRWILMPPEARVPAGWPVIAESDGLRLVENPGALPRAFAPRSYRGEPDTGRRLALLAAIRDFREQGVITEDTGSAWTGNGTARVAIDAYREESLAMTVTAEAATLVGTSITAWPGWKARLDGAAVPVLSFNNAFLAFRVPAGTHRVTLRYAPDGYRNGVVLSAATAALCAFLSRRRSPAPA